MADQCDTLRANLDLVENDPDRVEQILNSSVRSRIDHLRLIDRLPTIIDGLVDTKVRVW